MLCVPTLALCLRALFASQLESSCWYPVLDAAPMSCHLTARVRLQGSLIPGSNYSAQDDHAGVQVAGL